MVQSLLRSAAVPLLVALLAQVAWAGPRLQIDSPLWDFGVVTNQGRLLHEFALRNTGDAELKINRLSVSCEACQEAAIDHWKIPPGGAAVVHSWLDLRKLNGPITRNISIYCNDPENSPCVLGLSGTVVPIYTVTPTVIALDLSQGQRVGEAEISSEFQLHAPLSQVWFKDTNMTASVSAESSNKFKLTVRALEPFPHGRTVVGLEIRSTSSNDPPCLLHVMIHNPGDFEVMPGHLMFRPQPEPQTRILWLKKYGAAAPILLDAVPPSDKFRCEIEQDADGAGYRLYVTAWQQDATAGQSNALILKMRDQDQHEQAVPIPILVNRKEPQAHD